MNRRFGLLVFCIMLTMVLSYHLYKIIYSEYNYSPIKCTINSVSTTLVREQHLRPFNLLHVQVSYQVDGVDYSGEVRDNEINEDFKNDKYIDNFAKLYPLNSQQNCFYDPATHTVILNKVKHFYSTVFTWVLLISVFPAIAIFFAVIPLMKDFRMWLKRKRATRV